MTPHDAVGRMTLKASTANLCNTIIGTGMLATPGAFRYTGLLPGIFLIFLCGFTALAGLLFLTLCADTLGGRKNSFNSIAMHTFPKGARLFDAAIAIKCFGVSISYLIICGQLMPQVVTSFAKALHRHEQLSPLLLDRNFWIFAFTLLLMPLCFMRRLDSLRHTSYLSMIAVFYLVLIVIFYSLPSKRSHLPPPGPMHLIHIDGHHFLSIFPIFVFAFTCAQNMLPIYNEIKARKQDHLAKTRKVIFTSISLAGSIYLLIGVLGYLSFGSNVGANIITMYPSASFFVCFGRLSIVVLTLCSYPLQVHPCRAALDKIFSRHSTTHAANDARNGLGEGSYRDDEQAAGEDVDSDSGVVGERGQTTHQEEDMSLQKLCILTCLILVSTFLIAILVDDLGLVLGFVGSVGSTSISFILPGILFSSLHKEGHRSHLRKRAQILAIYGVIVMVISLTANVLKLYNTIPQKAGATTLLSRYP
ncbi:hypothetical protein CBS101457_001508 [Exobasidium rhododendri]|nr:hypothetical protein CBS101457_001508 [Exobasidium rhododendri]